MKPSINIADFADSVLAGVLQEDTVKTAEVEALRAVTPRFHTEIGQLMHKVANDLRAESDEVTYADLATFLGSRS